MERFPKAWRLALATCGMAAAAAAQDAPNLVDLVDPRADNWLVERIEHELHGVVDPLGVAVENGASVEPFFVAAPSQTAPEFVFDERVERQGVRLSLSTSTARPRPDAGTSWCTPFAEPEPVDLFSAWIAPMEGLQGVRFSSKVIAARHVPGRVNAMTTRLRGELMLQVCGRDASGATLQRNATAELVLACSVRDSDGPYRIERLAFSRVSEAFVPAPRFEDVTEALLERAGGEAHVLARSADEWRQRIDAVGEPNLFGHNGIAIADVNGDERDDVYVATGTGLPNLLFLSQPDGTLREQGFDSRVAWLDDTKGVLLIDHDGDGDRDLVCAIGPAIVICENDGKGFFTPVRSLNAGSTAAFYSLAAADYDLDGDLDLFGVRYVKTSYGDSVPQPFENATNGPRNHLLRNDGEDGYVDVTDEVGLGEGNFRFSLAATWVDYDEDGDADLYVANDFGPNNLYRNDLRDGGGFVDVAEQAGVLDQAAGMGASWGDANGDGHLDLLVSNMFSSAGRRIAFDHKFALEADGAVADVEGVQRHALGNSLFVHDGDGGFADHSDVSGLRMGRWAWGAQWIDLLGDGFDDVCVPNGFLTQTGEHDL